MQANNPQRGCGTLVKGGFYLQGPLSPFGTLKAWTWALGDMVEGGHNVTVKAGERSASFFDAFSTLSEAMLIRLEDVPEATTLFPGLNNLPQSEWSGGKRAVAILDHVGSAFYTPWSFVQECIKYGPSRRMPQTMIEAIIPFLPIPVFFTHSAMPITGYGEQKNILAWAGGVLGRELGDEYRFAPTFERQDWGGEIKLEKGGKRTQPYTGADHYMIPVLEALDAISSNGRDPSLEGVLMSEQIIGFSWYSRASYIKTGNESEADLDHLKNKGFLPLDLEDGDGDYDE